MPPWTSRILPSTSSSSSHSNQVHAPPPPFQRNGVEPDRTALIAIDHNVPILSPTTPTTTARTFSPSSRNRRRSHARSISQPFPSLMNANALRKTNNRDFTTDFGDDETAAANKVRTPGEEMVNGKCMTCNSTCRWPRHIQVFRCTVCLTVNDLEPRPPSTNAGPQHDDMDGEVPPPPPPPPPKDGAPEPALPGMLNLDSKLRRRIQMRCFFLTFRSNPHIHRRDKEYHRRLSVEASSTSPVWKSRSRVCTTEVS
jgi:E3 ubiquitin-protein ligase HECTD2